ncbi:MAG: protease inhibitor I9 family protein, partial [Microbacterium sp.]
MSRTSVRAAAVVTLAALFTGTATASFGATPEEVTTPIPIDLPAGRYIVLLDEAPAATYDGGESGLAPTKPDEGEKLDASSREVEKYSSFLEGRQEDVAAEAGVKPDDSLTITLNAFTANLSAAQAAKLAGTKGVQSVVPDEILHPDAVSSTEFLGLEGPGGVWE